MPGSSRFEPGQPLATLLAGAIDGEQAAWDALVERLQRVVWKAVNMMTFDTDVREDAFAATWLRLAERLGTIRDPERLPGWLATTACNEVRQIMRQRNRHQRHAIATFAGAAVSDAGAVIESLAGDDGDHARSMVLDEARRQVRAAFAQLDEPCRELVAVLVLTDPPLPYDEAAAILGRPIGALGPTRRRCLDKLKSLLQPDDHQGGTP